MFDYKMLEQKCEYEVRQPNPDDNGDCGEPAIAEVWWDLHGKDTMYLCAEHFRFVKHTENKFQQFIVEERSND